MAGARLSTRRLLLSIKTKVTIVKTATKKKVLLTTLFSTLPELAVGLGSFRLSERWAGHSC